MSQPAATTPDQERPFRFERSLLLDIVSRAVIQTIAVFSVYLLFAGHNAPGGGFIGGLVAGTALVLRYIGQGPEGVRRLLRVPPEALLGGGLLLAGVTGATAWAFGGQFLESAKRDLVVPVLGEVHATSVLPFDVGVYLVVVGVVLVALTTLGTRHPQGADGSETDAWAIDGSGPHASGAVPDGDGPAPPPSGEPGRRGPRR